MSSRNEQVQCSGCGSIMKRATLSSHLKTKKHMILSQRLSGGYDQPHYEQERPRREQERFDYERRAAPIKVPRTKRREYPVQSEPEYSQSESESESDPDLPPRRDSAPSPYSDESGDEDQTSGRGGFSYNYRR